MNILVTGANSKIAITVIQRLSKHHNIIAISRKDIGLYKSYKNVTFVEHDLSNQYKCNYNLDYIIHLASHVPYNKNKNDTFQESFIDNVLITKNILDLSVDKKIKKIIYASSIDVYGKLNKPVIKEEYNTEPLNYYGLSKIAGEDLINVYFNNYNLNYTIFRIPYVLSYYMEEGRFIKLLLNDIKKNKDIMLYNKDNILNIIHTHEISLAFEKALTGANGVFNLSKNTTLQDFTNIAKEVLNSKSKINFISSTNKNTSILSSNKLISYFGKNIFISLENRIIKTMEQ